VREAIKVLAAKGLVKSWPRVGTRALAVVEAIGRAEPAGARESMEALIASTAREAGSVVEVRPAIGRNT
jgi:DNA-binding FadR family transcriptional regulator